MRTIEYRRWSPPSSALSVEFPVELLREQGWTESTGVMYGSRQGKEVRIQALGAPADEEQEKVGVFVSRLRGEVFLTESDLVFLNQQKAGLALVVAGRRAGFFVREPDGSIQTVRSHEEFSISEQKPPTPAPPSVAVPPRRKRVPARVLALAMLPLAAIAVWPQRSQDSPQNLEIHASGRQLRISWKAGNCAVLAIRDGRGRVAIPVYADQSSATFAPEGDVVEVSLMRVDAQKRVHVESTRYISAAAGPETTPRQ